MCTTSALTRTVPARCGPMLPLARTDTVASPRPEVGDGSVSQGSADDSVHGHEGALASMASDTAPPEAATCAVRGETSSVQAIAASG